MAIATVFSIQCVDLTNSYAVCHGRNKTIFPNYSIFQYYLYLIFIYRTDFYCNCY